MCQRLMRFARISRRWAVAMILLLSWLAAAAVPVGAADPALTITPNVATCPGSVVLNGTSFPPNIRLGLTGFPTAPRSDNGAEFAALTVPADGNFTITVPLERFVQGCWEAEYGTVYTIYASTEPLADKGAGSPGAKPIVLATTTFTKGLLPLELPNTGAGGTASPDAHGWLFAVSFLSITLLAVCRTGLRAVRDRSRR